MTGFLSRGSSQEAPMKVSGKEAAYVATIRGVGLAVEGEMGFYLVSESTLPFDKIQSLAERMNQERGIDPKVADELHNGSMFGWGVPAAGRFRQSLSEVNS